MAAFRSPSARAIEVVSWHDGPDPKDVVFAGIVPFIQAKDGTLEFLTIKPRGQKDPQPGGPPPPRFQFCKGGRDIDNGDGWVDMRKNLAAITERTQYEDFEAAAKREAREELGLKATNIRRLFRIGTRDAVNELKGGTPQQIFVYAAELKSKSMGFVRPEAKTKEIRWMHTGEMDESVFAQIISELSEKLRTASNSSWRRKKRPSGDRSSLAFFAGK